MLIGRRYSYYWLCIRPHNVRTPVCLNNLGLHQYDKHTTESDWFYNAKPQLRIVMPPPRPLFARLSVRSNGPSWLAHINFFTGKTEHTTISWLQNPEYDRVVCCYWYALILKPQETGNAAPWPSSHAQLHGHANNQSVQLTSGYNHHTTTIEYQDVTGAHKTLGVWMRPPATIQLNHKTCWYLPTGLVLTLSFTCLKTWTAYKVCWLPKISYFLRTAT
jgi:hypothetical protein